MLIQICVFSKLIPQKWIKSICHLKKRQDLSSIIKRREKNPLHFETIAKMLKTYFFFWDEVYVHMVFF